MRITRDDVIFTLVMIFIFWPWGVLAVDVSWWILTEQQVSTIQWQSLRGMAASLWPFVWIFLILIFTGV